MSQQIKVTVSGSKVVLDTPYNPDLPAKAKAIGGRWDSAARVWTFDARDEDRVRALAREVYGTDGSATKTVTVQHKFKMGDSLGQSVWMFGREIVQRPSRDEAVRLGDGVIIVEGKFQSTGGSRANPAIGKLLTDVVVEIRDVAARLIDADDEDTWVMDGDAKRAKIEARIAELRAELADMERQLSEM
jgi:hypothetical protein